MTPRAGDWDAARYQRVAQPHAVWGASVLDRLRLHGDETVLDAGCGSGKVTRGLVERLPAGLVIAADVSPAMLAEARVTLAEFGARVRYVEADLLRIDAAVDQQLDAVFSTATFHWIDDHERLFAGLARVLRPGGQLVSQFGGGSNLAGFMRATEAVAGRSAYRAHLAGKKLWRFYASPEQTRERLAAAGFTQIATWLEDSPQTFSSAQALDEFARTVVLRNHLGALPPALHDAFAGEVMHEIERELGGYQLDYVRLNADAIKA